MKVKSIPIFCLLALLLLPASVSLNQVNTSQEKSSLAKTGPIHPSLGQYANFSLLQYAYNGALLSTGYYNITYLLPTVDLQGCINATRALYLGGPFLAWQAVNTSNRQIVAHSPNMWSGASYYEFWIPLSVGVGDNISWWTTPGANATVTGSETLDLLNRTIDCWKVNCVVAGVSPDPKDLNNTAWFDKSTGHCVRYIDYQIDGYYNSSILNTNIVAIYKVHNLNTSISYVTIQEAIDAPDTLAGHIIFVEQGVYYENVVITKSLSLIGENKNSTIIDGDSTGSTVHITADKVFISNFTIQNSGICWPDSGILVDHANHNRITNNIIRCNSFGVVLLSTSNNTLTDNLMNNNDFALLVMGEELSDFLHSIPISNFVDGKPVYYFVNQRDLVISPSTHPKVGYLAFINSVNMTVKGLTLAGNCQGLLLAFVNNSKITENRVTDNLSGIDLIGSLNNSIYENNVTRNGNGIRHFVVGSGICLSNCTGNSIFGNNVTNNYFGISSTESSDNLVYHNNFMNNTRHVFQYHSVNAWDNGIEGNYWSNYTGVDLDQDGIGDSEYKIDSNNTDHYPLMSPYLYADVNHDAVVDIYDVTFVCICYDSEPGDFNWDARCDIAEPWGIIDIYDVTAVCICYGNKWDP